MFSGSKVILFLVSQYIGQYLIEKFAFLEEQDKNKLMKQLQNLQWLKNADKTYLLFQLLTFNL
jgi:hypothetical protein